MKRTYNAELVTPDEFDMICALRLTEEHLGRPLSQEVIQLLNTLQAAGLPLDNE